MTDASIPLESGTRILDRFDEIKADDNRYVQEALAKHKHQGLVLAVRARWAALVVIAVMLPFLNSHWSVLFYHAILLLSGLIGYAMLRLGRVGQSRWELLLIFLDLFALTVIFIVPLPFGPEEISYALALKLNNFQYFYMLLALGTMAFTWRTVTAIGTWTTGLWTAGVTLSWWFYVPSETDLAAESFLSELYGRDSFAFEIMNPNSFHIDARIQELVLFLIVAIVLSLSGRRFQNLLMESAAAERARTNLSRYFSPNVVEQLSGNDEPLKQIRTQDVAVMFVDIAGFTSFAADRDPKDVIDTLRQFHARMETEVFAHGGTLDKYLGDGMMVTFGTPMPRGLEATNALTCARVMLASIDTWNAARSVEGQPELRVCIGVHYGPCVLGDIGANRLEFAVIGNTVNVASRLEALTRDLSVQLIISDETYQQVRAENGGSCDELATLARHDGQRIRGIEGDISVWSGAPLSGA